MMPVGKICSAGVARFKHFTEGMAIGTCCKIHVLGVFLFFHVAVLKDFAIDIEAVWHEERQALDTFTASCYIPEIILGSLGVERVGG